MEELYTGYFIQFLFNECSCEQLNEIAYLIQTDAKFNAAFAQLNEAKQFIDNWATKFSPSDKTVRNIILYAKANR